MKKQNIFIRILKFFRLLNDNGDLSLTNILLVAFSIKFLLEHCYKNYSVQKN